MPLKNLKLVHINGFALPFPTVGVLNAIRALKNTEEPSHLLQETASTNLHQLSSHLWK